MKVQFGFHSPIAPKQSKKRTEVENFGMRSVDWPDARNQEQQAREKRGLGYTGFISADLHRLRAL